MAEAADMEDIDFDPAFLEFAGRLFAPARTGSTIELAAYVDQSGSEKLSNDTCAWLVMMAGNHGHADLVQALANRGADVDRANARGQTPLAGAVFKGED